MCWKKAKKLNQKIKDAESVTFTWKSAPEGAVTTDVSQNKDGSIVLWNDDGDCYISSQRAGQVIYMNAISSKMFKKLQESHRDTILKILIHPQLWI